MRLALLLAALGLSLPAAAADKAGRFATDGAGAAPCSLYLDARAKRDSRYFQFGGFIEGFTSAMNIYERDTFDITPWQSTDLVAAALAEACRVQPRASVGVAMGTVARRLMPARLRARDAMVVAGGGAAATPLYAATIRQVQTRLNVPASGQWDGATQRAVANFQRGRKLPASGAPDQVTLYLLLQPGGAR